MRSTAPFLSRARGALAALALAVAIPAGVPAFAQTPAPAPDKPAEAPAAPATPTAPTATPSDVKIIEMTSRPALVFSGQSSWDDSFTSLSNAFQRLKAELDRAGLKSGGRPVAVFVSTDDAGFRFEAMTPLAEAPASPPQIGAEFKIGETPAGRAVKFEHRGAYEEIDSTYEAITAWLDDKGLESRDFFVEEYVKEGKGADDTELEVDVYVYVK